MARWTASAKWAAGPALDGQRDMPLALRLSEGLGPNTVRFEYQGVDLTGLGLPRYQRRRWRSANPGKPTTVL